MYEAWAVHVVQIRCKKVHMSETFKTETPCTHMVQRILQFRVRVLAANYLANYCHFIRILNDFNVISKRVVTNILQTYPA